jgi:hypothetical protein
MTARGALANDRKSGREAIGRSRGGLTTKIHLAADLRCRPVARLTSAGQHGDSPRFIPLMDAIRIQRRGKGRPRRRPGRAMADKAYSSAGNRAWLRQHPHPGGHPRQGRPEETPPQPRPRGRPPAGLRRRLVQEAQHRRALLQQAQAVPRRRHPIRQTRADLPGHHRRRLDQHLATRPGPMMIRGTRPSAGCRGSQRVWLPRVVLAAYSRPSCGSSGPTFLS